MTLKHDLTGQTCFCLRSPNRFYFFTFLWKKYRYKLDFVTKNFNNIVQVFRKKVYTHNRYVWLYHLPACCTHTVGMFGYITFQHVKHILCCHVTRSSLGIGTAWTHMCCLTIIHIVTTMAYSIYVLFRKMLKFNKGG